MVEFLIKSILSLGILYVFNLLFLSHLKTFHFNRYYLLGSLVFSLIIPFVNIPVDNTALPLIQPTGNLSISSAIEYSGEFIVSKEIQQNTIASFLPYFYAAISLILFLRFSVNLFNIIKTIFNNQKIKKEGYSIVLLRNQVIPYSFFKCVLVNKKQYQNGAIDNALFQHEITHCRQWHSLDILVVELLKVFFWINPFIWLMKKTVQLNHEFLADNKVLTSHDFTNYKNLLINLVIKHNNGILISNFNFSLTKQRLKMMTKQFSTTEAIFGKVTSLLTLLLIGISLSFVQKPIIQDSVQNYEGEWWYPILKKHNIEPSSFNSFENVFEMGTKNSISNGIVTLENALFLFKPTDEGYVILRSQLAYHNTNNNTIDAENGEFKNYKLDKGKVSSIDHIKFEEISIEFKKGDPIYIKISGGVEVNNEEVENN